MADHNLDAIEKEAQTLIGSAKTLDELEAARVKILGRKGLLTAVLRSLKDMKLEDRRTIGPRAQELRAELEQKISDRVGRLVSSARNIRKHIDVTRPGIRPQIGTLHPLTEVERQVSGIFSRMGFSIAEGPDIETEFYNFDALNMAGDHPAREMWDTFWLRQDRVSNARGERLLLRTHTSPVQIRYLESVPPPLRIIVPGSVFRYEAIDATHNIQFLQLEGLLVDKNVSIANFKAVIGDFLREFFGENTTVRLRPSYFPFVEPGFEVDARYNDAWIELMGAGMVHPNVYKAAGLNPADWQGFAFGMGIDRLAMVKYGIRDIRNFYENDIRFLRQF